MTLLPTWKASILEGLGSMALIWFIGIASPVFMLDTPLGVASGLAFLYGTAITLMVLSLKSNTGAFINPLITLSHLAVGSITIFRAPAYLLAQMVGSAIGGAMVAATLGDNASNLANGGCTFDPASGFRIGQAFSLEFMSALIILTVVHGIGHLNPPSGANGSVFGPLLYGLSIGLINFCTSGFAPHVGYIGANGFPNVCFGLSMGILKFQSTHWVFWVPGLVAVIIHGGLYRVIQPHGSNMDAAENVENSTTAQAPFRQSGTSRDQKNAMRNFFSPHNNV